MLKEDERIDDLHINGFKIIQKKDGFCFGIDAVLLSHFIEMEENDEIIDLGTGTGIIPILLASREKNLNITGIDIVEEISEMAQRSIKLNLLENVIKIVKRDIKDVDILFKNKKFDTIVSNPPYTRLGAGLVNNHDYKAIARHEILCTLEDVIKAGSKLVKQYGKFYMINRTDRLIDIITLMKKYKFEPKMLRFIHPKPNKAPNLILIKAVKCGRPQLNIMPPLYVYNEEGSYTQETLKAYGGIYSG